MLPTALDLAAPKQSDDITIPTTDEIIACLLQSSNMETARVKKTIIVYYKDIANMKWRLTLLLLLAMVACTKQAPTESESQSDEFIVDTIKEKEPVLIDDSCIIEVLECENKLSIESSLPLKARKSIKVSSNSSSSYSTDDESTDYWEEKRKHSPNKNYLQGFDEDVDDIHDMEGYMEDY